MNKVLLGLQSTHCLFSKEKQGCQVNLESLDVMLGTDFLR